MLESGLILGYFCFDGMLEPLPYPGMFFDAVLATRVIHHPLVGNIKRIVSEIDRVLKNGGYVLLQVPEYEDHERVLREAQSTHRVLEPGTHVPLEDVEEGVPTTASQGKNCWASFQATSQ